MHTRFLSALVALAAAASLSAPAFAETAAGASAPAAAAHAPRSTEATALGELLDDAAARAVLMKHIPAMISNPQIDMARSMTLKSIQPYSAELTDAILAAIDAELAALSHQH